MVQAQRTSANLHEPQLHRESKVWRGLSHAFGVVRLYRTFSMYLVTGETRSAGCLCNRSGWFKHIEPHRTYSNHNITELARCGEVCHMSSGWFDCTEPSLATAVQGETRCAGCLCTSSGWFKHSEPQRTYTNHSFTERARCGEVCHMRSGWFDCTEPSLSTALQGKQGVQGAYALVRGGSSTANLIEPTRTTTSQS